jgi:hypothetical protein
MWKNIKRVGRNNIRELGNNSRGRWGHIPGIRGGISIGQRRKSRAAFRV